MGDEISTLGFAYWSGYAPGKENPDEASKLDTPIIPLDADELLAEALRFRRGADRALAVGDPRKAERLSRAADEHQNRAEEPHPATMKFRGPAF